MSNTARKRRHISGEMKTFVGLLLSLICFFVWLDYREESHEEISGIECADLNVRWKSVYHKNFEMTGDLRVQKFDCPSQVSGLARGLKFIEDTGLPMISPENDLDFWNVLLKIKPALGNRLTSRFSGVASYKENRIDINPVILTRGDPVEVAGVLIHEARHLQQGSNTHVPCANDRFRTCDPRLEENLELGGAYNYNILFYHQVIQSAEIDAQKKRSARKFILDALDTRFNVIKADLRKRYEP